MQEWRISNDGNRVVVVMNGKGISIPWQDADTIAKALIANARTVEENEKAAQVIMDAAIMARAGVPIGITSDPVKQAIARNEAAFNRDIRRSNLPKLGSVPSQEVFGTPLVENSPSLEQLRKMQCQTRKT